jgi:hypothetical protein
MLNALKSKRQEAWVISDLSLHLFQLLHIPMCPHESAVEKCGFLTRSPNGEGSWQILCISSQHLLNLSLELLQLKTHFKNLPQSQGRESLVNPFSAADGVKIAPGWILSI